MKGLGKIKSTSALSLLPTMVALLFLCVGNASASSIASGDARLYWNTEGLTNLDAYYYDDYSYADVGGTYVEEWVINSEGAIPSTSAEMIIGNSQAAALTNESIVNANVYAQSDFEGDKFASAFASRYSEFVVTGGEDVSLTISWELSLDILSESVDGSASIDVGYYVELWTEDDYDYDARERWYYRDVFGVDDLTKTIRGTTVFEFYGLEEGQSVFFAGSVYADGTAYEAVPIPATALLFCGSILGIIGVRRKMVH